MKERSGSKKKGAERNCPIESGNCNHRSVSSHNGGPSRRTSHRSYRENFLKALL